tara:strand:+ start:2837 stop:3034 length:198 start_codon:yes stop_codon:yes gene_type:complete
MKLGQISMLYKVTITGHRGELDIMYMDEKTFKSMSSKSVVKAEIVKPKGEPPNKDNDWRYHQRVF